MAALAGTHVIAMIIGGDLGLSDAVLSRADLRLSISPMTFTHQMVRLILLEQVYRACRSTAGVIYVNNPYGWSGPAPEPQPAVTPGVMGTYYFLVAEGVSGVPRSIPIFPARKEHLSW